MPTRAEHRTARADATLPTRAEGRTARADST